MDEYTDDQLRDVMRGYDCHGDRVSLSGVFLYGLMDAKLVKPEHDSDDRYRLAQEIFQQFIDREFIEPNEPGSIIYHTTAAGYQFMGWPNPDDIIIDRRPLEGQVWTRADGTHWVSYVRDVFAHITSIWAGVQK